MSIYGTIGTTYDEPSSAGNTNRVLTTTSSITCKGAKLHYFINGNPPEGTGVLGKSTLSAEGGVPKIRHLDLFSGIGGFALAGQMVGGIETTQFVEIDSYCQKVLAKNFPGAPIHDDIRTFTAQPGDYDLITAGFPCQPHSQAGKRKASQDERDLWPELYRIICDVQPRWCVFENVRGLLSSEAGQFFRGVLWDLARAGLDAEWAVIPASDLGASHRRERVWIVAYSTGKGLEKSIKTGKQTHAAKNSTGMESKPFRVPADAANSNSARLETWQFPAIGESAIAQLKRLDGRDGRGFTTQPLLCRGNDGLSRRVDRIKGLGNAVTPQQAAIALQRVLELAGGAA